MRLRKQKIGTETLESSLSEPHFEEEWTVLSARQVVPISDLEAEAKKRYSLKLVGAFVLASSLGALVALTSIRLRELNARVAEPSSIPETAASTTIPQSDEESTIPAASETSDDTSTTVSKPVRVNPRKHETVNADFEDPASDDNQTESSIDSKPQPRLVDQWQEDRPRRVQPRRNRNDDDAHHQRDLRDLDEIFEGSPKKP